MKALVDHSGILQFKYILRNEEDLMSYHSISAHLHGRAMLDLSEEPNRVRDVMSELAKMRGDSMFITATKMANEKTMAMLKHIQKGKVIVVNMAGGWCFWDDKEMKEITIQDFMDTVVEVDHNLYYTTQGLPQLHRDLKYAMSYVWPDVPKNVSNGDIIKLHKNKNDQSHNTDPIYLKSNDNGEWILICTKCADKESKALHTIQMNRHKQLTLLNS